jgi:alpha-D-ribose 1-methylphosphonate 5-triphosphate diphosphatase
MAGSLGVRGAMTGEFVFSNAHIVMAGEIIAGSLCVRDGIIADLQPDRNRSPHIDLDGAYLIPGLVELHTDHLENHCHPRPGVTWPAIAALLAHDAQIAAAGITTVFDALRAGAFEYESAQSRDSARTLIGAISEAKSGGMLRADHLVHLRCELPCPDTAEVAAELVEYRNVRLLSVMNHTPGERQFVDVDKFREYYLGKKIFDPIRLEAFIAECSDLNRLYAARNRSAVATLAKRRGLALASHDDATEAHVEEAIAEGVVIAEFPTTEMAARKAHEAGLSVLMGAPNLVRGGSHSGNISTAEVASAGRLDILSSDYVPASLLHAAFDLPQKIETVSLPEAIRMVTLNPAHAAGLDDRGEIKPGKRADLTVVEIICGHPVVKSVWRAGVRVI